MHDASRAAKGEQARDIIFEHIKLSAGAVQADLSRRHEQSGAELAALRRLVGEAQAAQVLD